MAVSEIGVHELAERIAAGARVVDVRELHEWESGRIAAAVHVPLATVPDQLDAFRSDEPVLVICHLGGRSRRACEYVSQFGIEAVNVAGGMAAWQQAGYPVETDGA